MTWDRKRESGEERERVGDSGEERGKVVKKGRVGQKGGEWGSGSNHCHLPQSLTVPSSAPDSSCPPARAHRQWT